MNLALRTLHSLRGAAALAGLCVCTVAAAQPLYRLVDLGTLPGGSESTASAINAAGQVTGWTEPALRAFRTDDLQLVDLGSLGGNRSIGYGINAAGWVTGESSLDNVGAITHAFRAAPGASMTDLGTLGGATSVGRGINASGHVVGRSETADGGLRAFVSDDAGHLVDLGTLGGDFSEAYGINDAGQVTGWAKTPSQGAIGGPQHAFITDTAGHMTDLGSLAGADDMSEGFAINALGQVTGMSTVPGGDVHAFVTDVAGQMRDLGALGAGQYSRGYGINLSGQVVGDSFSSLTGQQHAFVTLAGLMTDLNDVIGPEFDGWIVSSASGINDHGQISALAFDPLGHERAVLLYLSTAPIPEPASGVLMVIGGALLLARRRRAGADAPR